jgi:hypothetical protein
MKTVQFWMTMGLLLMGLCGMNSRAATPTVATNNSPLTVILNLEDGSRLVGKCAPRDLPLRSAAIGKIQIPLQQIRAIKFSDNKEVATVTLQDGDKLQVNVLMPSLEVRTVFGNVAIRLELIRDLCVSAGSNAAPDRGLVLHYCFNKDGGDTVTDRSPCHNDGRVHGAKFVTDGNSEGACRFNGNSDFIHVPFNESYHFTADGQFTIAAWVNTSPRGGAAQAVVVKAPADSGFEWGLYVDQQDHFMSGWEHNHVVQSVTRVEAGKWYHLVVTYEAGRWSLYINGERESEASGKFFTPTTGSLAIGRKGESEAFPDFFRGTIAAVRLYNRALSAEEIAPLAVQNGELCPPAEPSHDGTAHPRTFKD